MYLNCFGFTYHLSQNEMINISICGKPFFFNNKSMIHMQGMIRKAEYNLFAHCCEQLS